MDVELSLVARVRGNGDTERGSSVALMSQRFTGNNRLERSGQLESWNGLKCPGRRLEQGSGEML